MLEESLVPSFPTVNVDTNYQSHNHFFSYTTTLTCVSNL